MSESTAASAARTSESRGAPSGAVTVPSLHVDDRPLVIVLHPTGHVESGSPRIGWVLVGYLDTDEHGGTRTPVILAGTDLGLAPTPVEPVTVLGVSRVLCAFLVNDLDRKEHSDRGGWTEDRLPDYTGQQWQLLQAEYERMQCHAADAFTADSGAGA